MKGHRKFADAVQILFGCCWPCTLYNEAPTKKVDNKMQKTWKKLKI